MTLRTRSQQSRDILQVDGLTADDLDGICSGPARVYKAYLLARCRSTAEKRQIKWISKWFRQDYHESVICMWRQQLTVIRLLA